MGSDSNKAPKPKHRFSFNGPRKPPREPVIPQSIPVAGDSPIANVSPSSPPLSLPAEPFHLAAPNHSAVLGRHRGRGSLRGVIVIFLGGFVSVWLYGYVTKAYEIPFFSSVTQSPVTQTGVELVSSHPVLAGAVSGTILLGVLGAFYLHHRKKN